MASLQITMSTLLVLLLDTRGSIMLGVFTDDSCDQVANNVGFTVPCTDESIVGDEC